MCEDGISTYPCGHSKKVRKYCQKAKLTNIVRLRQPDTHCGSLVNVVVDPDLEESCGGACLTIPWQCSCNVSAKQVGWKCASCHRIRDSNCLVWAICNCARKHCLKAMAGSGFDICQDCLAGCDQSQSQAANR